MAIELNTDPKHGCYPWWPASGDIDGGDSNGGDDWVHPEDIALARSTIPSSRVWRRDGRQGNYVVITYGKVVLRVLRVLWREIQWEGFDMGDLVEVRTRGMKNEHRTGTISQMQWNDHTGKIVYQVRVPDEQVINPQVYAADDLKHIKLPESREEARIEPASLNDDQCESGDEYDLSSESA